MSSTTETCTAGTSSSSGGTGTSAYAGYGYSSGGSSSSSSGYDSLTADGSSVVSGSATPDIPHAHSDPGGMDLSWIENFDLFLFDFDGTLVNTRYLMFKIFVHTVQKLGASCDWSFQEYELLAQTGGLQEAANELFRSQRKDKSWTDIKKRSPPLKNVISKVQLMPGVQDVVERIIELGKTIVVVTRSTTREVKTIQRKLPVLKHIDHWITKGAVKKQKPDPEAYTLAVTKFASPGDRMIGIEDSPEGCYSLLGARGGPVPVLVSTVKYPRKGVLKGNRVVRVGTLHDMAGALSRLSPDMVVPFDPTVKQRRGSLASSAQLEMYAQSSSPVKQRSSPGKLTPGKKKKKGKK